ncbi:hypothetical protein BDK51DRAFT_50462 [Blyttiomyces helicus]|uniref:Dilute domain-containing protein n=1 Tax=Blyttiomyces helicus TaxID=388810 RepID=A0A4P9VTT6_9FUNG|nr:hypothetical protein BDK51DRAFT_50462 [Blyttiomyces helicus]|eukprot:RKO82944.1 hypothetical protein BDK51DRAFT_50462 [Blyttiomyces helicus]
MWACSNAYEETVQILVEAGANRDVVSVRGRSLKDIVLRTTASRRIFELLELDTADMRAGGAPAAEGDNGAADGSQSRLSVDGPSYREDDLEFDWDKCPLDQMLVFDEQSIDHICDVAINRLRPIRGPRQTPIAANIIFLCARFSHYYNSEELTQKLFAAALRKIVETVRASRDDSHLLAYWISNAMQLLYYLKKDTGLVATTFGAQSTLSELIHELVDLFVHEVENRLSSVTEAAMMDFSSVEQPATARLENAITGLGRRRTFQTKPKSLLDLPRTSPSRTTAPRLRLPAYRVSPRTVTSILDGTLHVLHSCRVHPSIVDQMLRQIFAFFNADVFNRIVASRTNCCRSRAVQIRLNLSTVEDGGADPAPAAMTPATRTALLNHLRPTLQLTRFLQVISSVQDMAGFIETMQSLETITMRQAMAAMRNYKWEVGETSFAIEVEMYVQNTLDPDARLPFQIPALGREDMWIGPTAPALPDEVVGMLG